MKLTTEQKNAVKQRETEYLSICKAAGKKPTAEQLAALAEADTLKSGVQLEIEFKAAGVNTVAALIESMQNEKTKP